MCAARAFLCAEEQCFAVAEAMERDVILLLVFQRALLEAVEAGEKFGIMDMERYEK